MKSVGDDTDRSRERLNCPLKTPCYTFPCLFGHSLAYQVNNWFGSFGPSGSACGGTVNALTPCDDASYLEMMQQGIYPLGPTDPLRSQYIEVWATNAITFTNAI
jgi:hypothetical protein